MTIAPDFFLDQKLRKPKRHRSGPMQSGPELWAAADPLLSTPPCSTWRQARALLKGLLLGPLARTKGAGNHMFKGIGHLFVRRRTFRE